MHVRLLYSESLQKSRPPTLSPAFHLQTGVEKNRVKKSAGALKKKKKSIVVSLWRRYMKIKPRRNFFKTHLQKKKSDACWKILNSFVSDFVAVIPNTSENNHWVAYFLFFFSLSQRELQKRTKQRWHSNFKNRATERSRWMLNLPWARLSGFSWHRTFPKV